MKANNIVKFYTEKVESVINAYNERNNKIIYVFLGLNDVIDISAFNKYIVDDKTFNIDGNNIVFSKEWFMNFFIALSQHEGPKVVSFAQFSYLTTYLDADYYKDVILIRD